ncbi:MAG: poly-beta-1,6-N-acetyl-D-glucosamine N-deacetylase PgaB [Deltaproteobacteria bacterium]|nr:poly-beta-1,6-N-acetyl-D-glucosamine N-deacetylase PgaB [Deltaproteobacteria bacterium]
MNNNKHSLIKFALAIYLISISTALPVYAVSRDSTAGIWVLCYHDVTLKPSSDPCTITHGMLAQQIEYLRTHGYHFVGIDELVEAKEGRKILPPKSVLLTFDDAYLSFYEFVFPLLRQLKCPAVLGVVGHWIDMAPKDITAPLMNWDQLREVADSDLVEIASHTYNLHRAVCYNPQGNSGSAVSVRLYLSKEDRYETEDEYRGRIREDMQRQNKLFLEKLGSSPRVLVWPYGRFNMISLDEAKKAGIIFTFGLENGTNSLKDLYAARRLLVQPMEMSDLICEIEQTEPPSLIRAAQVDLDLIYDPASEDQTDRNLGLLIERLLALGVNTIYLQAFADPDGTGRISGVYFPNRHLEVRADIFSHAVHQIMIRGIRVYAWMPTLGVMLPDRKLRETLKVKMCNNVVTEKDTWKLSPFAHETHRILSEIYEDLATHSQISGVLFQDDAVLSDHEDCHPCALKAWADLMTETGKPGTSPSASNPAWISLKTRTLDLLLEDLMFHVRRFRPYAKFCRNIFAGAVINPASEEWFAQSYSLALQSYDYVVVMAYPQMERRNDAISWLKGLMKAVRMNNFGLDKTVLKIQAYDWGGRHWIDKDKLLKEMRVLEAHGARHLAYYPDNVFKNQPDIDLIRLEMSTKGFPYMQKK